MSIDGFKNRYIIIILAILWYCFTSTNVFYSKLVCTSKVWSLEVSIVTILLLQYLAGCVPYLCSLFVTGSSKSIKGLNLNKQDFMVGFFYLLGNLGALLSLASTSISVNQILKALEPVFSAGLSAAIFHTYLSSHQVLYMMLAISGACLAAFKDLQFNWFAFSMAFLSNVSFATRNVFLKLSPQNQQSSSLEQQGKISICAAVFLIPHWSILCMSRTNEIAEILYDFSMLKSLIIVAVSHTIYNYCSITVLSNVENVVQHALLNIMKRPFTIITLSFTNTNQSDLTPTTVMGVMVLVTGQILFKFNPTCKSSRKRRLRIRNLRVVKLLPLIVLMTPFFFYSGKLMTQSSWHGSPKLFPSDIMDAPLMRGFAINYLKSRYRFSSIRLELPTFELCVQLFKGKLADDIVNTSCNILLLKAITPNETEMFQKDFSSEWPQYCESSQTKNVLFHLLMNRIVRYTHAKRDILSHGRTILDQEFIYMYYWYNPKARLANWGDILGPVLVQQLSHREVIFAPETVKNIEVFYGIGSILSHAMADNRNRSLFTWGSGLIKCPLSKQIDEQFSRNSEVSHKYFSVRGPETQMAMLALVASFPLVAKDPGLLVSNVFQFHRTSSSSTKTCLIPHYADQKSVTNALKAGNGTNVYGVKVISISAKAKNFTKFAEQVAREIISCRRVLSSSLHGVIASHAYGIPGAVISLSSQIAGGNFKYRDYYESLGLYMHRDTIRHRITNMALLKNVTFLSELVEKTPQPKFPIDITSVINTYPFPVASRFSGSFFPS